MRRQAGQSIVEMAFVLPILLIVLFGIMEFGYLIFAYSTVSQAARNGAETASQLPPYQGWLNYQNAPPGDADYPGWLADPCVNAVIQSVQSDTTLFNGEYNEGRAISTFVTIRYPNGGQTRNLIDRGPIEVTINYPVRGITPLFQLLNFGGTGSLVNLRVTQRRSLENLGNDPTQPRGVACAADLAEYRELFPD